MLTTRSNLAANAARNHLRASSRQQTKSVEKLSSGYRISRASDDAAGLSVGTNLNAQIKSLQQASRNASLGLSVLKSAEAALASGQETLLRLRELSMQHLDGSLGKEDKLRIIGEMGQVLGELDRITETAEFNGMKLLDGSLSSFEIQVGDRGETADVVKLKTVEVGISSLGIDFPDFFGLTEMQTNNVGTGPERAAHALVFNQGIIYSQNRTIGRTDNVLNNAYGPQTVNITSAGGPTEVRNIAAGDTAHQIASSLDAIQGVTATAENAVRIFGFSPFAGNSYLNFHDGVNADLQLNINGKTLAEIATAIAGDSAMASRGISARMSGSELHIYAQNGDDVQLDINGTTAGYANMQGLYSYWGNDIRDTITYNNPNSSMGNDVNRIKTYNDSTLANGYGSQTMTFNLSGGGSQTITTSANDTAAQLVSTLNGISELSASARNEIRLSNISTFSGSTYLRFHDGINANKEIQIQGDTIEQIKGKIDALGSGIGAYHNGTYNYSVSPPQYVPATTLTIYSGSGHDIQLDASSATAGQATIAAMYSAETATIDHGGGSNPNSATIGGKITSLRRQFPGSSVDVSSSNSIFQEAHFEANSNWSDQYSSGTVGGIVRLALDGGYGVSTSGSNFFESWRVGNHAYWTNSYAKPASSMVDSDLNTNNVGSQSILVSGVSGSASVTLFEGESAKSVASKIDGTYSTTGVMASARTEVIVGNLSHNGDVSFQLAGDNGTAVAISATVTTSDLSNLVNDINAHTDTTGISAILDPAGNSFEMVHASGEDIRITDFAHSTAVMSVDPSVAALRSMSVTPGATHTPGSAGVVLYDGGNELQDQMDGTVVGGEVLFSSYFDLMEMKSTAFGGTPVTFSQEAPGSLFNVPPNTVVTSEDFPVIDRLSLIDEALHRISTARSEYGAEQNRLLSIMSGLDLEAENMKITKSASWILTTLRKSPE